MDYLWVQSHKLAEPVTNDLSNLIAYDTQVIV